MRWSGKQSSESLVISRSQLLWSMKIHFKACQRDASRAAARRIFIKKKKNSDNNNDCYRPTFLVRYPPTVSDKIAGEKGKKSI